MRVDYETLTTDLPVGTTATVDLTQKLVGLPHCFIAVTFKTAAGAVVTPTAGTYTLEVRPHGMANFVGITGGAGIDATAAVTLLSYLANGAELKFTPGTAITGNSVTTISLTVTGNKA